MSLGTVGYSIMFLGSVCYSVIYLGSVCYSVMSLGKVCYNVMSQGSVCYSVISLVRVCYSVMSLRSVCYKDSHRHYARSNWRMICVSYQKCTGHKCASQVHESPDRKLQALAPATYLACQQEILSVLPLYY